MADPNQLSEGAKLILGGAAYFIVQLCSNAWTTHKLRESAKKVIDSTPDASQTIRTEGKVDIANKELKALKEEVLEIKKHLKLSAAYETAEKQSDYVPMDPQKK